MQIEDGPPQAASSAEMIQATSADLDGVDWTGWSEWVKLETLEWSAVPQDPGAYIIAVTRPINRAVGIDPDGFLDVGETDGLRARLRSFRRCASQRGCEGHMAGWRFAFFRFGRTFPLSTLRVRWLVTITKEEAYAAEGQILLAYLRQHYELPPLNYKFNRQVFKDAGWDILDDDEVDE